MVYLLAFWLGLVKAVDTPTRQHLSWRWWAGRRWSTPSRSIRRRSIWRGSSGRPSPAALIATVGMAACFLVNGLSYFAVLAVLVAMRARDLHPAPLAPRMRGQLRQGLRYVRSSPVAAHDAADDGGDRHLHLRVHRQPAPSGARCLWRRRQRVRGDDGRDGFGRGGGRSLHGEPDARVAQALARGQRCFSVSPCC